MAAKTVDKLGKNMAEFLAGLHSHFILIKIVYALAARASTPLFINRLRKTRIEQPILRSTGVFFSFAILTTLSWERTFFDILLVVF